MLEDPHPMDHKKNIRANPSGLANSNSDQRLNTKQDVAVGKSTRPPRFSDSGNRRRSGGLDTPGSGESRGTSRRGQIKRPPPRSFPSKTNYPDDNQGHPMTQADEFEVGSVFNQGSKKQNFNHLLNFNFEPRGYTSQRSRGTSGQNPRNRNEPMRRRPKYSKELYLQANCQFIVREGEDYDSHLHDADHLVDWNLIEQVNLKTTADVPSCPICLYPPTAAKITRCGHVFCWSCILHYLSLSDHSWRKCPICDESIYRQDLKSVVSVAWKEFQIGDEIEMHLMRRERNSLFALPVDSYFPEVNEKHPNIASRSNYSQLATATPAQVAMHIIAREKHELEAQYRSDQNEPESCFIEEALQYVSERENGIVLTRSVSDATLTPLDEESPIFEDTPENTDYVDSNDIACEPDREKDAHQRHTSSSSDGTIADNADVESPTEVTAEDLDISQAEDNSIKYSTEDGKNGNSPKSTFYFYQSSDGQPIFLHAINVQMFVKEFGAFENCPKVIRGRIVEKDGASMTQDLRNKLRYLKHLPVTSSFDVCELEMSVPKFSKQVLEEFQPQLDARRRRRKRREREEKRRDKQITIELNKTVMGQYPDPKLRIESSFHFPEVGSAQAMARSTESLASVDSALSTSPSAWGASSSSSMSFAKMLRQGGPPRPSAPIQKPSAPSTQPQYVTLTALGPRPRLISGDDSEPDPEDYVPPPPKANIGDVLAMALERSTLQDSGGNNNNNAGGKKKGKKMKGKMISLTSGGGRTAFN